MKVLLIAMAVFAVSGASAGLLGIGGALIFNPYLLQLGMDPRVSPQPPLCLFHVPLSGWLCRRHLAQICVWFCDLSRDILLMLGLLQMGSRAVDNQIRCNV